jgi:Kinase binding protein CGI-121
MKPEIQHGFLKNLFREPSQLSRSSMQTFDLQCSFPTDPIYVFLFTEVSNAIALRSKLLAGDPEYRYAFLDASLVDPSPRRLTGSRS